MSTDNFPVNPEGTVEYDQVALTLISETARYIYPQKEPITAEVLASIESIVGILNQRSAELTEQVFSSGVKVIYDVPFLEARIAVAEFFNYAIDKISDASVGEKKS